MKTRKFGVFLFILAALCALVASVTVVNVVNSYRDAVVVLKVTKDIQPYEQITSQDVIKTEIPRAVVGPNTLTDEEQVIGKYSRTWIPEGTIMINEQLATIQNTNGGVALPLSEMERVDMRAIGISEEFLEVIGSGIREGDHLDLVGVFQDKEMTFARTIAYAVPVIRKNTQEQGNGVVVAVTTKQAEEVALAMNFGRLVVSLTPYDFESKPLPGTYLNSLYIGREGAQPNVGH